MVVMDHVRCGWQIRKMDDNTNVNAAILERLEKVVQSLQENSVKMGELQMKWIALNATVLLDLLATTAMRTSMNV